MLAVFKREFKAYFLSPVGYIFLAAMYFFLGLYFWLTFSQGVPAVPDVVMMMNTVVMFVLPVLTMRMLSEDRRQKVDQALLTAPVKLSGIVMGKFLAAFAVYAIGFAPTVIFEMLVASFIKVNVGTYLYALFGMLLFGGILISLGMFISSLTESTALAGIVTFIVNLLIIFMPGLVGTMEGMSNSSAFMTGFVKTVQTVLEKLSVMEVLNKFSLELFSVADVIYMLSFILVFIFLSVRSLDKRRWA